MSGQGAAMGQGTGIKALQFATWKGLIHIRHTFTPAGNQGDLHSSRASRTRANTSVIERTTSTTIAQTATSTAPWTTSRPRGRSPRSPRFLWHTHMCSTQTRATPPWTSLSSSSRTQVTPWAAVVPRRPLAARARARQGLVCVPRSHFGACRGVKCGRWTWRVAFSVSPGAAMVGVVAAAHS